MVFAEIFERTQFKDYSTESAYVNYREMAKLVKKIKTANDPTTPAQLFDYARDEERRVKAWLVTRVAQLCDLAEVLRSDCVQRRIQTTVAQQRAEAIEFETLRVHECRCLNNDALRRIYDRLVAYSVLPPPPEWVQLRQGKALFDISVDRVWYGLSAAFSYARGDDASASSVGDAVGSQDFVRRSVKYWVHPQDLPVVIARVIRHLPLSIAVDTYAADKVDYSLGSAISSVYFDNQQFGMYHKRMRRLEGSSLFRVRWYGDEQAISNPDREVFAELKVHHEAWSGEASTKRRFALKNSQMDAYLRGDLPLTSAAEQLRRKGAKPKDVDKFKNLAIDMLTMIVADDLKPALRTEYERCAFQRGKDQSVRVSIDTKLRMRAEDFGASKHWRAFQSDPRHSVELEFAVVEVKIQCSENDRVPAWVEELMKCRHMESIPKFSKYAHGVAALYGSSKYITVLPYWLHQVNTDIRAATKVDADQFDAVAGLTSGVFGRVVDSAIFGHSAPQARRSDADFERYEGKPWETFYELQHGRKMDSELSKRIARRSLHVRHANYMETRVWDAHAQKEAECFGINQVATEASPFGDIPGQTAKRVRVPQKFDPKTFFTAERYFLRWVESSVSLGLAALFILHFGDVGMLPIDGPFWASRTHVAVGVIMMCLALLGLAYALIQFHARSRRVYARVKIRFDDEVGPSVLTGAVILGMAVVAFAHVTERFGHLWL